MIMKTVLTVLVVSVAGLSPALAHVNDVAHAHGVAMGFAHPLNGMDHVLGMLALGLWAGCAGGMARWVWPLTFVAVACIAAILGQTGFQFAGLEALIACSVVGLGAFVCLGLRLPVLAGMVVSAAAAFVHGYAHGIEMTDDLDAAGFMTGFLLATAVLHAIGLMLSERADGILGRLSGAMIALYGSYLLVIAV